MIGYRPSFADDAFVAAIRSVPLARVVLLPDAEAVARHAEDLDGLVCGGNDNSYGPEVAAILQDRAARLRWIQVTTAGIDALDRNGVPEGVTLTGNGGAFNAPVAEHAFALLLAISRGIVTSLGAPGAERRRILPSLTPIEGTTLAVVGIGGIGREVAARAQAFGMRVIGINRTGTPVAGVADVRGFDALDEALACSDAVVICLPLTPATHHLFDAGRLARLKPRARLVNVGRGAIVDTDALVAALQSGHVGGAGLDVTQPEPLPEGHPLWTTPNTVITPHVAPGGSLMATQRIADVISGNLRRFLSGDTLQHVVRLN